MDYGFFFLFFVFCFLMTNESVIDDKPIICFIVFLGIFFHTNWKDSAFYFLIPFTTPYNLSCHFFVTYNIFKYVKRPANFKEYSWETEYFKAIFLSGDILISLYDFLYITKCEGKNSELVFNCAWSLFSRVGKRTSFCCNNCQVSSESLIPWRDPLASDLAVSNKCSTFILTLLGEFDWNYICPDNTQQSALLAFVSRYIW